MEKNESNKRELLYVKVHDQIKDIITEDDLKPGDKLPSETELMAKLGVSRGTIRQAIMLLRESGVIYNHQGKGTFLSKTEKDITGLEKARYDLIHFAVVPIEKRELTVDYVPSFKTVQKYMGQSKATLMARFQIQYYHANKAIAYLTLLIPFSELEESGVVLDDKVELLNFIDILLQSRSSTSVLTIDQVESRDEVAKFLDLKDKTSIFCLTEIAKDKTNTTIAYSKFYCLPEFFEFKINRG